MNDEDWGITTAAPNTGYSNTISSLGGSGMSYLTVDTGYDFLLGPSYKAGLFVGYNYVHEQYDAPDCAQIASPSAGICTPPITGTPVITETDRWDSFRLGLEAMAWLTPGLKLTAEAAYLPYVSFKGVDNHWLRELVIDEAGEGQGAQLEAALSYYFCEDFSVGVGGRYWAMWTDTGTDAFNGVLIARTDTYRYERYGFFLQGTYTFD
jgi:outer membrane protease